MEKPELFLFFQEVALALQDAGRESVGEGFSLVLDFKQAFDLKAVSGCSGAEFPLWCGRRAPRGTAADTSVDPAGALPIPVPIGHPSPAAEILGGG